MKLTLPSTGPLTGLLFLGLFAPSHGVAQLQPQPRDVGVFADQGGTTIEAQVEDFTPFDFYVLGFELDGQVQAYEFGIDVPAELTILSLTLRRWPGDVGNLTNVVVFTGTCLDGAGVFWLAAYTGGFFCPGCAETEMTLCVRGLEPPFPSSFDPPAPGYLQCDGDVVAMNPIDLSPYGRPDGCLTLNPQPVALESESFGGLKARY